MFNYNIFGERVKFFRLKSNLSLEVLAEKANINDKYLSRLEHGHHKASTKVAVSILRALGINFHTCLYDNDYDKALVNACVSKYNSLCEYEKKHMLYILENLI